MSIALPLLRFLALASLVLAQGHMAARAETVNARLRVSAVLVVTCTLDARVPRVGTPERSRGAANFSVTCTQGAVASAVVCPAECEARDAPMQRTEYRRASGGDGGTIATLLF